MLLCYTANSYNLLFMSDNVVKHIIALFGTLVIALAFIAGYGAGIRGWWWAAISLIVMYGLIIKILDT